VTQVFIGHKKAAGELMTTAYLSVTPDTTAEMAVTRLREEASNLRIIYYIYVVTKENVLQGVVSIKRLLTARSHQPLAEILAERLISVPPEVNYQEVLEVFRKYKFQALPVLDKGNHLKGVIPLESLLDILLPRIR
jgi:magnesium transporter